MLEIQVIATEKANVNSRHDNSNCDPARRRLFLEIRQLRKDPPSNVFAGPTDHIVSTSALRLLIKILTTAARLASDHHRASTFLKSAEKFARKANVWFYHSPAAPIVEVVSLLISDCLKNTLSALHA